MPDLIKAAKLWARTSAKTGGTYYVGRMGGCRVLVLENRDRKGEDEPTHWLMLGDAEAGQERDPARRPQARDAGGAAKHDARPVQARDGWRGPSAYRRPANGPRTAPAAAQEPFREDGLDDLYR